MWCMGGRDRVALLEDAVALLVQALTTQPLSRLEKG